MIGPDAAATTHRRRLSTYPMIDEDQQE